MNLKEDYKKETGEYVRFRETEKGKRLYDEDYVGWLERKVVKLCNLHDVINSKNYDAMTAGQLIDFLSGLQSTGKIVYMNTEDFSYITEANEYAGTVELIGK